MESTLRINCETIFVHCSRFMVPTIKMWCYQFWHVCEEFYEMCELLRNILISFLRFVSEWMGFIWKCLNMLEMWTFDKSLSYDCTTFNYISGVRSSSNMSNVCSYVIIANRVLKSIRFASIDIFQNVSCMLITLSIWTAWVHFATNWLSGKIVCSSMTKTLNYVILWNSCLSFKASSIFQYLLWIMIGNFSKFCRQW